MYGTQHSDLVHGRVRGALNRVHKIFERCTNSIGSTDGTCKACVEAGDGICKAKYRLEPADGEAKCECKSSEGGEASWTIVAECVPNTTLEPPAKPNVCTISDESLKSNNYDEKKLRELLGGDDCKGIVIFVVQCFFIDNIILQSL